MPRIVPRKSPLCAACDRTAGESRPPLIKTLTTTPPAPRTPPTTKLETCLRTSTRMGSPMKPLGFLVGTSMAAAERTERLPITTRLQRHGRRRETCGWQLDADLHLCVLRFLDRQQLASVGLVSREWLRISRENQLWETLCRETWRDKAHVRLVDLSDLVAGRARLALQQSIQASTQLRIDAAELCRRNWSFRFKRAAGRAWTAEDPWWDGRAARTLQFLSDGTVAWATGSFDWVPPMRWALEEAPVSGGSGGRRSRRGRNGKGVGESRQTLLRITAEDTQQGSFPGHLLIRHSRWGYVFHSPWVSLLPKAPKENCRPGLEERELLA